MTENKISTFAHATFITFSIVAAMINNNFIIIKKINRLNSLRNE